MDISRAVSSIFAERTPINIVKTKNSNGIVYATVNPSIAKALFLTTSLCC